jgi:undecaprenyl-diphosphatase
VGAQPAGLNTAQTSLSVAQAAALGAIQGPAELLPVSSSAHLALVSWLAGWRWSERDGESRKAFEVALHAGAAAAIAIGQRDEIAAEMRSLGVRSATVVGLGSLPPAIAGLALERPIENRLGGPRAIAAGLVAGAIAMVIADRRPRRRAARDARAIDGLALGLGQAAALAPGVSRSGAVLAAARWREFTRPDAASLCRAVALPVIAGAALLKGLRLRARGIDSRLARAMAAGVVASFASTLGAQRTLARASTGMPLWPYAAYRITLAAVVLARVTARERTACAPEGARAGEP